MLAITNAYYDNTITLEEFTVQFPALAEKYGAYEKKSELLFTTLNTLKKEDEVLGFENWHMFLASLGNPLIIFCLSVFLFINAFAEQQKLLRQAKLFLASTACITGCFFLTWVFAALPDLPFWTYVTVMFICAFTATLSVRYLIQWLCFRKPNAEQLRKIIQNLIDFIAIDIRDKYIRKEYEAEFKEDTFKTLEKGIE